MITDQGDRKISDATGLDVITRWTQFLKTY
jgi:hypothetical protein